MKSNYNFQIRVTGILIEDNKILLVKQKLKNRNWSLPGGRLENGETLEQGILREMHEETGLSTSIVKLLYICDKPDVKTSILHITFLLERVAGEIKLPTNEFDENPIHDVKWVPVEEIREYGFSNKFKFIVQNNFPMSGSYAGLKSNIGL